METLDTGTRVRIGATEGSVHLITSITDRAGIAEDTTTTMPPAFTGIADTSTCSRATMTTTTKAVQGGS